MNEQRGRGAGRGRGLIRDKDLADRARFNSEQAAKGMGRLEEQARSRGLHLNATQRQNISKASSWLQAAYASCRRLLEKDLVDLPRPDAELVREVPLSRGQHNIDVRAVLDEHVTSASWVHWRAPYVDSEHILAHLGRVLSHLVKQRGVHMVLLSVRPKPGTLREGLDALKRRLEQDISARSPRSLVVIDYADVSPEGEAHDRESVFSTGVGFESS
jgi:hypothetical protein